MYPTLFWQFLFRETATGSVLWKKTGPKNFPILTGKHLSCSVFLVKLVPTLFRQFFKRSNPLVLPVDIAKFFRTTILKNIWEQLLLFLEYLEEFKWIYMSFALFLSISLFQDIQVGTELRKSQNSVLKDIQEKKKALLYSKVHETKSLPTSFRI